MAVIVLVHGSNHGAWCWSRVVPLLEQKGHRAVAIDLPSHGDDPTPVNKVTLEDYIHATQMAVLSSDQPVILVGHSAAGVTVASVAERNPEHIQHLIYLAAYAPQDGDSMAEMRKRAKRQLVIHAVQMAEDRKSYVFDPAEAPKLFYHDCAQADVEYALPRLSPQPIAPQMEPVQLGANYNAVQKSYIICTDDHTVPPEEQERLTADWPTDAVHRLDCGHSPFFVCPDKLVDLIEEIIT